MRVRPARMLLGAALLVPMVTAGPVSAEEPENTPQSSDAPVGPKKGGGERRIGTDGDSGAGSSAKSVETGEAGSLPSHRRGRAPERPSATLPSGAAPQAVDHDARRQVAGGPTDDDISGGANDEELKVLREAERVLFARPLAGVRPGWTWELPIQIDDGSPDVVASGLPPSNVETRAGEDPGGVEATWIKRLAMPDLPVRLDSRVVKYLKFYRDDARGQRIARVWAKKSGRLTPALKSEFAKAGLPTDLVWLSLIESGHNPTAVSPAGAAGLWQFIPESGRMYGLTVDRWVDERLDPQRATSAAIQYLKDLRARFGTWELAMAGYNMGHGGLLRAVRKFNTNDFWTLARYEAGIPWETSLYVPKILAIAIVMNNKKAFGIDGVQPESPISFDTVYVEPGVPLSEVARAARVPESEISSLNAQYLAGRVPPAKGSDAKRWPVRVPSGIGASATRALAKSVANRPDGYEPYVVRFGDSLDAIATDRGCDSSAIRRVNQLTGGERLDTGTVLLVPKPTEGALAGASDEVVVVPARRFSYSDRKRVFYRVVSGDTLDRIGRELGVSASELSTWNALDGSANLQQGMVLQAYVPEAEDLSSVRIIEPDRVRVLIAGSDEFFEHFEGLNDRKRIMVTAREGDTLSSIGKRYGMSTGMMERINRFSRSKKLSAGDRIVVYTKRANAGDGSDADSPKELSAVEAPRPEALPSVPAAEGAGNGRRAILP